MKRHPFARRWFWPSLGLLCCFLTALAIGGCGDDDENPVVPQELLERLIGGRYTITGSSVVTIENSNPQTVPLPSITEDICNLEDISFEDAFGDEFDEDECDIVFEDEDSLHILCTRTEDDKAPQQCEHTETLR